MPRTEELAYVRTKIAAAIAARIADGLTYDEATAEAFAYCDRRWPALVAAIVEAA